MLVPTAGRVTIRPVGVPAVSYQRRSCGAIIRGRDESRHILTLKATSDRELTCVLVGQRAAAAARSNVSPRQTRVRQLSVCWLLLLLVLMGQSLSCLWAGAAVVPAAESHKSLLPHVHLR